MEDLVLEYAEKFNDVYPYRQLSHLSEEEHIKLIKEAIEANKPIELDTPEDRKY